MLFIRKPSPERIRAFLEAQSKLELSYPAVGATAAMPPAGYSVDHTRMQLGRGEPVFSAAKAALEHWDHFRLGWVEPWPAEDSIRVGAVVAVAGRFMGLWWLNACRIVYLVAEDEAMRTFGFAYGTLPDHAESGEERFMIEWNRQSDEVWYDILAFSRPNQFLSGLGYPMVRRLQKRFARDSAAAMARIVSVGKK